MVQISDLCNADRCKLVLAFYELGASTERIAEILECSQTLVVRLRIISVRADKELLKRWFDGERLTIHELEAIITSG